MIKLQLDKQENKKTNYQYEKMKEGVIILNSKGIKRTVKAYYEKKYMPTNLITEMKQTSCGKEQSTKIHTNRNR